MSESLDTQEQARLHKFIKVLTLKVAQVVVQSRQGKKITHECSSGEPLDNCSPTTSSLQWFNLSIPDEPQVNYDTSTILNGEVVIALTNVLCIEISLKTNEGDEMVLEIWTVKLIPGCDLNVLSASTIYYRMSVMLKSTLSISRITPAYRMSRAQHSENYKVYHKIYGGPINLDLLGEKYKTIRVSDLRTPFGSILLEVLYRTTMTILPTEKVKTEDVLKNNDIMVKSDHFPKEIIKRDRTEKKEIDLTRPLTAGAFVDSNEIRILHDSLIHQLPPEPVGLKADLRNGNTQIKSRPLPTPVVNKPGCSTEVSCSAPSTRSKAIDMPHVRADRYTSLMEFPFADGSPITDLANFYQECLQAKSASEEWTEILKEASASTDSESLSQQLKMFEEAVPEFDNMVASMFSNSEQSDT